MKNLTSFGSAVLGVWLSTLPHSAWAQGPAVPEPPPAPAPAPAPALPETAPPSPSTPSSEPHEAATPTAGTAPAGAPIAADPVPPSAEPAAKPAGEPSTAGAGPANADPAAAQSWQIPVVDPAAPEDSEADAGFSGQLGSHQEHWIAWLGLRNDYVRDATYDLFATNDALTVFSVGGGRTVWAAGNLSLAALGLWEIGGRSAETRGNEMSLRVQRLQLLPEVRYHVHYRVYGFARLGLGAEYVHATLENELFGGSMVSNSWAFAGDLAGGAAVQVFGHPRGEQRSPRMWLSAEGGYAFVTDTTLSFAPESDGSNAPERAQTEELGELDLSAPYFRLAVLGTY